MEFKKKGEMKKEFPENPLAGRGNETVETGKGKILIIDDEEVVLEVLGDLLFQNGYQIVTSKSGQKGIEFIKRVQFDLILLDKNLPDRDWERMIGEIRGIAPEIPIIIITGYPSLDSITEAINLKISNYLIKPFADLNQVCRAIEKVLRHHRLQKGFQERIQALQQSTDRLRAMIHEEEAGPKVLRNSV